MANCIFKSPCSNVLIEERNGKIKEIRFTKRKIKPTKNSSLKKMKVQILEYLKQRRTRFSLKVEPDGTDFQKKVWKQISLVEYGKTKKMNNSPRAVGNACGANPCLLVIPCHRIISKSGNLSGFSSFGGIVRKSLLISLEANNPNTN